MKFVFADAFYWIALLNPKDSWHEIVINYRPDYDLLTTDVVLNEILNIIFSSSSRNQKNSLQFS